MNDVRMTFGEHLEELRSRLIKSLLAFLVAFLLGLAFQDPLFRFYARPYKSAAQEITQKRDREIPPTRSFLEEKNEEARLRSLVARLARDVRELGGLKDWNEAELAVVGLSADGKPQPLTVPGRAIERLITTASTETFMSYMKVCLLTGFLLSAPVLLYQLWSFISAGLYRKERRLVLRTLPLSLLLFFLGCVFSYAVLVPISLQFLLSYGSEELINQSVRVESYLNLLIVMLVLMGLVFQIPLLMVVLTQTNLLTTEFFKNKRRYFIVAAFIFAAVITPPDYVSQILVAIPMLLLFEVGLYLSVVLKKKKMATLTAGPGAESPPPAQNPG